MSKSSINIQPVKNTSESHNLRLREFKYVIQELSYKNEIHISQSIKSRLQEINKRYFENVGQHMQRKSVPIREAVVLIKEETTIEDIKQLGIKLKNEFGIEPIQCFTHKDEGHYSKKTGEWKPNLHAHIVFDWTDHKGKSIKLKPFELSKMQTIVAQHLQMERGQPSTKAHLDAIEYKIKIKEKELAQMKIEILEAQKNKPKYTGLELMAYINSKGNTSPDFDKVYNKQLDKVAKMYQEDKEIKRNLETQKEELIKKQQQEDAKIKPKTNKYKSKGRDIEPER